MCGITGIISHDSSLISRQRLKLMTDKISHRGPDGEGFWINPEGTAGFGHRRLSIIDLSDAGHQPMHLTPAVSISRLLSGEDGATPHYTIIHNGEIYNYIELKKELISKGYKFSSQTDTEVIAAAYDCYKEDCLQYFDGMFSFAIWDEKEKELFAARDRFGEKPFFFYYDEKQFVFASEMKALWASGIERIPNLKLLFNYLTIGYVDNPAIPEETFFENISKLPAASYLKYSIIDHQCSIFNYWDIDVEKQHEKISDAEAIEKFKNLFYQSVKRRLRSDVPVGTSLSGGLDSSSVVAAMINFQNSSPGGGSWEGTAFSVIFPGYEKDEYVYSKIVADKFRLKHFTIEPSAKTLPGEFEKLFYHQEEPFGSASIYAQFKLYELAKRENVKVLLDGQGADESLAGYHKYFKWYWQELFRKRKLTASHELQAAKELGITEKFGWKNRIAALFPEFASIFLEKHYLLNALKHEDLTKDFVRLQSKEAYYAAPEMSGLNGILYFNTRMHGLEELLRYADRNSMAHGLEIRLPFLNHELVEFVFSLPSHFKIRQGWTKWLLRKAMENEMPAEIVWRKDKIGYEPPQREWMQEAGMQEAISHAKEILVKEKILKKEVLSKKNQPHDANAAESYDWRYLSSVMLF